MAVDHQLDQPGKHTRADQGATGPDVLPSATRTNQSLAVPNTAHVPGPDEGACTTRSLSDRYLAAARASSELERAPRRRVLLAPDATRHQRRASQVLVGRGNDAAIKLTSSAVSRRHAVLTYSETGWALRAQSLANVTHSSGVRLRLADHPHGGDHIGVGSSGTTFTYASSTRPDSRTLNPGAFGEWH